MGKVLYDPIVRNYFINQIPTLFEKSSDESSHFCNMRKILNHHIDDMKPLSDPIFNRTFEYRDSRIDYVIIKDYNFHSLALK